MKSLEELISISNDIAIRLQFLTLGLKCHQAGPARLFELVDDIRDERELAKIRQCINLVQRHVRLYENCLAGL